MDNAWQTICNNQYHLLLKTIIGEMISCKVFSFLSESTCCHTVVAVIWISGAHSINKLNMRDRPTGSVSPAVAVCQRVDHLKTHSYCSDCTTQGLVVNEQILWSDSSFVDPILTPWLFRSFYNIASASVAPALSHQVVNYYHHHHFLMAMSCRNSHSFIQASVRREIHICPWFWKT